jgi:uncharacterized protein
LTPKASRNRIEGIQADADGASLLKVSVTAVPEAGKANAALIKLLAKSWKLPKSTFSIISGTTDRRKTLMIDGDTDRLMNELSNQMDDC